MAMYQGPPLPPLVIGVEDPVGPHAHPVESIVGLNTAVVLRGELETPAPHQHLLSDMSDYSLWELVLWQQVMGG